MPDRKYLGPNFRFGFNGKENDNEVKGNGSQQDYGMRIYDSRLARFLSVDPLTRWYPELTPYQFASNRPIDGIDQDGLEWAPPLKADANGKLVVDNEAAVKAHTAIGAGIDRYVTRSNAAARQSIKAYEFATGEKSTWSFRAKTYFASYFSWNGGGDYTDADDISVLKDGKHASGDPATFTDKAFAGIGIAIPYLSGGAIRKLFKGTSHGLGKESVEAIIKKVDNISTALDEKHVNAAINDILGNPIIINGKTYDHLTEVKNALKGIGNQIEELNNLIGKGKLSEDVLQSAQTIRSELQRKKDDINAALDRATKKAAEKRK